MSYDDIAQPWQPHKKSSSKRIPKQANSPWIYMHHPTQWTLEYIADGKKKDKKPIWLPKFAQLIFMPGVNGVGGSQDAPQTQLARLQAQDRGHILINPEQHDYLRVYPAINGELTLNKWQKIENLGGRVYITGDDEGFAQFRRSLVLDGTIKLPHAEVLAGLILKQQELIALHESKPHIPAAVKETSAAEQKLLDMHTATTALNEKGIKYYE